MDPSPSIKHGFRLVDLLVVAAVVCLLASLFVPFVSRNHYGGDGTRAQCQNQLKQIVMAIHNYAATWGGTALPSASSAPLGVTWTNGSGITYPQSFFFTILPFSEIEGIKGDAMYKAGMRPSTNGATWTGQVPGGTGQRPIYQCGFFRDYVCPADPTCSLSEPTPLGWVGGSYAANYQLFGTQNWTPKYNIANIPDGTANTVAIAERFAYFPGPRGQFTDPTGATRQAGNLWAWPANCGTSPPTAYKTPVPQNAAVFAYGNVSGAAAFGYGPVAFSPPQVGIRPDDADYRLVQSGHMTVVQVGMADGSVRGVAASVTQPTWQSAVLPDDGNELCRDW
jgi:hypothetical protein